MSKIAIPCIALSWTCFVAIMVVIFVTGGSFGKLFSALGALKITLLALDAVGEQLDENRRKMIE